MLAVVDTNVLLVSVSERSKYHWLYDAIKEKRLDIAITHDILMEYEEKIGEHWHPEVASNVIRSLLELPNVKLTSSYFALNLIAIDPDDNKFVDCAFAADADYIITNDSDFSVLKRINFPTIRVVNIDEFKDILAKFI